MTTTQSLGPTGPSLHAGAAVVTAGVTAQARSGGVLAGKSESEENQIAVLALKAQEWLRIEMGGAMRARNAFKRAIRFYVHCTNSENGLLHGLRIYNPDRNVDDPAVIAWLSSSVLYC